MPPRLYFLPKIHKPEIPYRPIISSINSSAHKLANFLSKHLPKLINFLPKHSIKNTKALFQKLKDLRINNSVILFSFDIVNLFGNIPQPECLSILNNALENSDLPDNIASTLFDLTQLTLDQNFSQFNNIFYKQNRGLAMGSPISPFLAELFMDSLEQIISNSSFFKKVTSWSRYVDDVFGLFNGNLEELLDFQKYLNSLHPNIKFTLEIEKNNCINFLDLAIIKHNNKLHFNIYIVSRQLPIKLFHLIPQHPLHTS